MSIVFFIVILVWIGYRLRRSVLDMPDRIAMAKFRILGAFVALVVGILGELNVGQSVIRIDPRIEIIVIPAVWFAILLAAEWFGEEELKKRGVKTSGLSSKKPY